MVDGFTDPCCKVQAYPGAIPANIRGCPIQHFIQNHPSAQGFRQEGVQDGLDFFFRRGCIFLDHIIKPRIPGQFNETFILFHGYLKEYLGCHFKLVNDVIGTACKATEGFLDSF